MATGTGTTRLIGQLKAAGFGLKLKKMHVNVGIGNASPAARLDVKGSGTGTAFALRIQDSAGTDKVSFLDNGNVGIGTTAPIGRLQVGTTPGAALLIVKDSGNVGIGITAPKALLVILTTTTAPAGTLYIKSSGTGPGLTAGVVIQATNDTALCCYATLASPTGPWSYLSVTCPN